MANQFGTIAGNAAGILKNYYSGPIVTEFNDKVPFYKYIEKGKEKWNGYQVVRPVKVRRNPGVGSTGDNGLLPAIGNQTVTQATILAKFNYLRAGFSGPLLMSSKGDKGAFVNVMSYEMSEGVNDLVTSVNRQLHWNGDGTVALAAAAVTGSTVVTTNGRTVGAPVQYLDVGYGIDIISATTGLPVAQGATITAITGQNTATATITLNIAVTCSASDIIVYSGSYNNDLQGIVTSQDGGTGTIFGISRSTYPQFQGNLVNAASAQLSLDLMQQAYNEARRRGGGEIDYIVCDFVAERYYNKLLVANKRYVNKVAGDGTFSDKDKQYLEFGGVPVVADKDCVYQTMNFIDSSNWKKYVLGEELQWADETGSYMIAQTSTDSFEMRLRFFANLFCEKPSAGARLASFISP